MYPKASMMSHSCVSNTCHSVSPSSDFKLVFGINIGSWNWIWFINIQFLQNSSEDHSEDTKRPGAQYELHAFIVAYIACRKVEKSLKFAGKCEIRIKIRKHWRWIFYIPVPKSSLSSRLSVRRGKISLMFYCRSKKCIFSLTCMIFFSLYDGHSLCSLSSHNIAAFTTMTELDDITGKSWGCHVYVCDLNMPWHSHK